MESNDQAILKTLLYSDIFHFPLTRDELWKFLIATKKMTQKEFATALQHLSSVITHKNGFYCLKGEESIIRQRKKNMKEVHKKLLLAKKAAFYLSFIPTIQFIG